MKWYRKALYLTGWSKSKMGYLSESYCAHFIHGNISVKIKTWIFQEKYVLPNREVHQATHILYVNNVAC
jgi:hypothetical protein